MPGNLVLGCRCATCGDDPAVHCSLQTAVSLLSSNISNMEFSSGCDYCSEVEAQVKMLTIWSHTGEMWIKCGNYLSVSAAKRN
jgi:hypothetical protein